MWFVPNIKFFRSSLLSEKKIFVIAKIGLTNKSGKEKRENGRWTTMIHCALQSTEQLVSLQRKPR